MCDAGAKSLKTLECGREKLMSVVRTTTLPHSLTTYRGIHGKLRLWSTNKTSFGGTRDRSRNHIGELCAKEAHGFSFRREYHIPKLIEILQTFQEEQETPFTVTGGLIGIFLSSKKFEIKTENETYKGFILKDADSSVIAPTN